MAGWPLYTHQIYTYQLCHTLAVEYLGRVFKLFSACAARVAGKPRRYRPYKETKLGNGAFR